MLITRKMMHTGCMYVAWAGSGSDVFGYCYC